MKRSTRLTSALAAMALVAVLPLTISPARASHLPTAGEARTVETTVAAGPSSAAADVGPTAIEQCNNWPGDTCFWHRPNYTSYDGSMLVYPRINPGDCWKIKWSDGRYLGARSLWNRTNQTQRVWSSDRCTGQNYLVASGDKVASSPFLINSVGGR